MSVLLNHVIRIKMPTAQTLQDLSDVNVTKVLVEMV